MLSKKTLVITLIWLLLVTYLVTCSYGATAKPAETVVYPQGCRCCLFDFSKQLITCAKVCCGDNCC
ncbi:hypothetical protein CDL12_24607 [Handroanthus impetiginosus]|uniref:Uncharacterized protein n=1 Tax=Handroanthus impetiginosus TaxID=429701 RepID=A0A2G9GC60_9LAMI|nr:hypothetical protein CDL12_24607 [Handroanthus impetiginosus]